jgi:hypothetical protein
MRTGHEPQLAREKKEKFVRERERRMIERTGRRHPERILIEHLVPREDQLR